MTLADRGDNDLEEVIHRLKKRNKELDNSLSIALEVNDKYQRAENELKAELAREKEDRQYNDLVHKRELADLFKGKNET
tara:strand:- start:15 stop:251 length:237 start_codon:yes stop_codon:yes gene_type:complete